MSCFIEFMHELQHSLYLLINIIMLDLMTLFIVNFKFYNLVAEFSELDFSLNLGITLYLIMI